MIRLIKRRLASASRGQAAVETALVLSIVMLLALLTLDVGRGIAAHLALTEATQEGAMVAGYRHCETDVTKDITAAEVQDLVRSSSSADSVSTNLTTVTTTATADYVTVRSDYQMPVITPLALFIFGPSISIAVEIDATNFNGDC